MKRKILILFLTLISAVCLCAGFSACDILDELADSLVNVDQSSSSGDDTEQDQGTTGGESADTEIPSGSGSETEDESGSGSGTEDESESGSGTEDESGSGSDTEDESGSGSETEDESGSGSGTEDESGSGSETEDESGSGLEIEDESGSGSETEDESGSSSETEDESGETSADITVREGNGVYGYNQLANETNGADMQSLYYQMYAACEAFITDTSDVAITNGNYTIAEISYSGYSLTANEAVSVWKVFYLDNPMYYWLSSSCVYSASSSKIYLCIDETYASYAARVVYDGEISAMFAEVSAITAQVSSELEKAMAIHDYIIGKINYAYQSDGVTPETAIWAHNITGASSMGYGVCEAYSKTYLALCLANGLDCVIVTGSDLTSGEAHAWNLVKIDGVWYGVDCTWDDTGDDGDLSYVYFGMNASAIASTRTTGSQTYGVNYLYNLPEVTAYGIQLVTLFKDGAEIGTYVNVDAAFAAMTDSVADYTIELYFYNTSGTLVNTSPATTVYIYSDCTPEVNSITINGIYTDLGGGYFYVSYLNIDGSFTLKCDFAIGNIILTAADLDLGEYTLTTSGYYCRLNGTIYDDKTTDTVSIKSTATSQTDIYAALNISYYYGRASISGTAVIGTYYGSDMLRVYGTVTIDKYISANETNYYNVYLQGNGTLTINNLAYGSESSKKAVYVLIQFDSIDEYPSLYMGGVEAQTYLFISGNISATEAAEPSNLNCPIAALATADDFANIRIYYGSENKTSLYTVNANNQIVYNN